MTNDFLQTIIVVLIGTVAYFTKKIMDSANRLQAQMQAVTPAIIEIQGKFTEAGHTLLFPVTIAPGSPLKLTDFGQKLIDASGFEKILADCRDSLVQKVKATKPTTNYDIQENSINVIRELLESDDDKLKPLKSYAFNNGLSVDILIPPAGIVLRDEVMKELQFPDNE